MDLEPWDPWREFDEIRADMDRMLDRFFTKVRASAGGRQISFIPTIDVVETGEDFRVFLSIPGAVEEDIDIAIESGTLVIRGQREAPYDPEQVHGHTAEWRYGYFERRIGIPPSADPDGLSATYQWGVLTVVIPKKKV
jgi:HSP20 family protein